MSEWMARQLTGALGWDGTPEYLIRDRDAMEVSRGLPLLGDRCLTYIDAALKQFAMKRTTASPIVMLGSGLILLSSRP